LINRSMVCCGDYRCSADHFETRGPWHVRRRHPLKMAIFSVQMVISLDWDLGTCADQAL